MKAIELIRGALQLTEVGTVRLVTDMRDAPLTRSTAPNGNHPLWLLGHLAFIEGSVPQILFGEQNSVEHWKPLFAPGTLPQDNAAAYPSFDEVLAKYSELRAQTLRILDRVGDAGLDQTPKHVPPGFEDAMRTVGQTFLLLAIHNMVHYGQIADARRVAGRRPLM